MTDSVTHDAAAALLLQFSEWLERYDFGRPDPSLATHTELVEEFLASRRARARPPVADASERTT